MRTFVITAAVNETPVAKGWAALQKYVSETDAKLLVVPVKYKSPTGRRSKRTVDRENRYAPEVLPFLVNKRTRLAPGLVLMADVPVQPTASNPLAGMEILAASASAIVGSPCRQVVCVPTDIRDPRVMWTTGAITQPRYGKSRAGARAKEHHSIGALVVEVERSGEFFVRHLCIGRDGAFFDLDRRYTGSTVEAACASAVVLGDIHVGQECPKTLKATKALVGALAPRSLVLHDVLDMSSRSHHRQSSRDRWDGIDKLVELEVRQAVAALNDFASWGAAETYVVRSNHDEHLDRWAEDFDHRADPINAPYWHNLMAGSYNRRMGDGRWPDLFAMEAFRLGVDESVMFLGRNDPLRMAGVECGSHGDKGINGSRGSIRGYAKLGVKTVIAHSHTPGWYQGCVQVGVTGQLNMGYNTLPSSWAHAHCVVHPNGKRQLIFIKGTKFRGGK